MLVRERRARPATSRDRSRHTPSTRRPPPRLARSCSAPPWPVADDSGQSTHAVTRFPCAGTAARLSPTASPRAVRPHAAASGSRASSGRPGSPSRRQSSAAAFGITGDASSATMRSASRQSPNTSSTAAASPALCNAHGWRSSMYALVARIRSQTAPNPDAKSSRDIASDNPSYAAAAAPTSGPSRARRGTTPPQ